MTWQDPLELTDTQWAAVLAIVRERHGACVCDECRPLWDAIGALAWMERSVRDMEEVMARFDELQTLPYRSYLRTDEWRDIRERALQLQGAACRLCNSTERLNVHHRRYTKRGRENPARDLTVLCEACHHSFHEHRELSR